MDNNDAVDVIASRLRHLHYLQQGVLRATLTVCGLLFTSDAVAAAGRSIDEPLELQDGIFEFPGLGGQFF